MCNPWHRRIGRLPLGPRSQAHANRQRARERRSSTDLPVCAPDPTSRTKRSQMNWQEVEQQLRDSGHAILQKEEQKKEEQKKNKCTDLLVRVRQSTEAEREYWHLTPAEPGRNVRHPRPLPLPHRHAATASAAANTNTSTIHCRGKSQSYERSSTMAWPHSRTLDPRPWQAAAISARSRSLHRALPRQRSTTPDAFAAALPRRRLQLLHQDLYGDIYFPFR